MFTVPALWVASATMIPLMLYTAWSDLKYLKIPNWIPLAALAIYVVTGLWGLSLDRFLWGLGAGAVTLVVFFIIWSLIDSIGPGTLGAGDVKLLASLVPFVSLAEALDVLILLTVVIFIFALVFLFSWGFSRKRTGLASLDQHGRKVLKLPSPFGVALAFTAIIHLGRQSWATLA